MAQISHNRLQSPLAFLTLAIFFLSPFLMHVMLKYWNLQTSDWRFYFIFTPQYIMIIGIIAIWVSSKNINFFKLFEITWPKSFQLMQGISNGFIAIGIVIFTSLTTKTILYFLGKSSPISTDFTIVKSLQDWHLIIFCCAAMFVAPIVEEILMRKLIYDAIFNFLSKLTKQSSFSFTFFSSAITTTVLFAMIFTSALFALQHFEWIKLMPIFTLALYLQYLRLRYKSIFPGIIAHAINNIVTIAILLIVVKLS